jgi:polar amino acid transport system substrate-binding protein
MMRRATAFVALLACAGGLSACDSGNSSSRGGLPPVTTPPTTAAPAPPAPDCGNPVASFAPQGVRPAPAEMPPGSYMAAIKARGALRAAVSADTLLFGFRDPITGELSGFDIEMVKEVAAAIFGDRNKVEFKVVTYAQRIPSLMDGSVDIVADVMTINCARWMRWRSRLGSPIAARMQARPGNASAVHTTTRG